MANRGSLEARITALKSKHGELEKSIKEEEGRPVSDSIRLGRMKRKKLRLREEIALLEATIANAEETVLSSSGQGDQVLSVMADEHIPLSP